MVRRQLAREHQTSLAQGAFNPAQYPVVKQGKSSEHPKYIGAFFANIDWQAVEARLGGQP